MSNDNKNPTSYKRWWAVLRADRYLPSGKFRTHESRTLALAEAERLCNKERQPFVVVEVCDYIYPEIKVTTKRGWVMENGAAFRM